MNLEETRSILKVLRMNYPHSFKDYTPQDTQDYLALWTEMFKEEDYNLVKQAVKAIITNETREFAPNIGQVRNKMYELSHPNTMSEQEAWNTVLKAINRSGYYSVEEFNKLPEELQKLVGNAQQLFLWSQTPSDELNTVVASNFMRSYKTRIKAIKEYEMLPSDVKALVSRSEVKMIE